MYWRFLTITLPHNAAFVGSDYAILTSELTFTSGSSNLLTECVDILLFDDRALEGNQGFSVNWVTADSRIMLETFVTIMDNDCKCWTITLTA